MKTAGGEHTGGSKHERQGRAAGYEKRPSTEHKLTKKNLRS
jgi:hypothetical protein